MDNSLVLLQEAEKQIRSNNGKPMSELAITLVSAAQRALEQATGIDEVKNIRDKLNGIEVYIKRQSAEKINSNLVAAQRMRTERQLGRMIPEYFPHGGNRGASLTNSNLKTYGISPFMSSRWQQMVKICPDDQDFETWVQDNLEIPELTTAWLMRTFANMHVSDDTYEWFTPSEYIEAARGVMGEINLDPASSDDAQKIINADDYYTVDDDGLAQPWSGNVWLNPPYNMPAIEQFVDRAIYEYQNGNIKSAIILTNNSTDTGWFHRLLVYPVCFTKGRIRFWSAGGDTLATRQGQALFYLGNNPDLFAKVFSAFGVVLKRYDDQ